MDRASPKQDRYHKCSRELSDRAHACCTRQSHPKTLHAPSPRQRREGAIQYTTLAPPIGSPELNSNRLHLATFSKHARTPRYTFFRSFSLSALLSLHQH